METIGAETGQDLRYRQCLSKRRYKTPEAATDALAISKARALAEGQDAERYNIYPCRWCGGCHVGRIPLNWKTVAIDIAILDTEEARRLRVGFQQDVAQIEAQIAGMADVSDTDYRKRHLQNALANRQEIVRGIRDHLNFLRELNTRKTTAPVSVTDPPGEKGERDG